MNFVDIFPYTALITSGMLIAVLCYRIYQIFDSAQVVKFVLIAYFILISIHLFRLWYFSQIALGTLAPSPGYRDLFRFVDIVSTICICWDQLEGVRLMFVPKRLREELARVYVEYEAEAKRYEDVQEILNRMESEKSLSSLPKGMGSEGKNE